MFNKRKLLIMGISVASILLVLFLASRFLNSGNITAQSPPSNLETLNPDSNPNEPLLVVPENPIGTLGVISSLASAIGLYVMVKKKR